MPTVFRVIVLLLLIVYFLFFLYHCIVYIFFPYDLDNEEGFILNQTQLLSHGKTIYPDLKEYPYTVGNYPPVFQFVCVPFTWIFGNTHSVGRSLSVLATLLIGLLIFLIVRKITQTTIPALVASLFPFSTTYLYLWAPYNRVDMVALLFSLLGIYYVWNGQGNPAPTFQSIVGARSPRPIVFWNKQENRQLSYYIYLALLFFVLSFYTKQSMVAAPIAATIYLLIKEKKKAGILAVGYVVSIVLILLIGNAITSGQFYRHLIWYNMNPFSWFTVWLYARNLIRFYPIFIILVLVAIFNRKTNLLFTLYFICSVVVAISCGKLGSAVNYLLEFMVAGSILLGFSLSKLQIADRELRFFKPIIIDIFLILQLIMIYHVPYRFEYGATPTRIDRFYAKETEQYVQKTDGLILSDDVSMLVRNQKPVLVQSFIMSTLARQGLWDQTPVVNDLTQQKFALLVLYFDVYHSPDLERYTEQMIDAIQNNYQLVDHLGKYWIYRRDSDS